MHEEESQLIILFCFFHHFLKRIEIAFKTFKGNSYSFSAFILEIQHFHVWVASLHTLQRIPEALHISQFKKKLSGIALIFVEMSWKSSCSGLKLAWDAKDKLFNVIGSKCLQKICGRKCASVKMQVIRTQLQISAVKSVMGHVSSASLVDEPAHRHLACQRSIN